MLCGRAYLTEGSLATFAKIKLFRTQLAKVKRYLN